MSLLFELDWIAIAVCTLVSGGLGAAWYSPALFGEAWMRELGKTAEQLGPPGPALFGSVVSCAVASISIGILCEALELETLGAGLGLGALIGVGVVAMTMLSDALFSGWGLRLYAIQTGYRALYLTLIGGLYGGWPL